MIWPFSKTKREKETLLDYAPHGLFDIHNHCLWGLDDGPRDRDTGLQMLHGLYNLGYRGIVATPHYNHPMFGTPPKEHIQSVLGELKTASVAIPKVKAASEVMLSGGYIEQFEREAFPAIANTFLVEFSNQPGSISKSFEEVIFNFQVKQRTLILAHVERYPTFQQDIALLKAFKQQGALLQLDIMSLVNRYGRDAAKMGWLLIEKKLVHLVATDIHTPEDLRLIQHALTELEAFDKDTFIQLAATNPKYIFDGTPNEIE